MTNRQRNAQGGFTIIETMIAIAVLSIGIMALVAAFATAVSATQNSQEMLIARQKSLQALESIYTARNTQQLTFDKIANVSSGGIFVDGQTPLQCEGPDGLVNTQDDVNCPASLPCAAGPECIVLPGPDGVLGTADDVPMSLANFTRQIQIANVLNPDGTTNTTLKQVTVTVTYTTANSKAARAYTVNALISAFR